MTIPVSVQFLLHKHCSGRTIPIYQSDYLPTKTSRWVTEKSSKRRIEARSRRVTFPLCQVHALPHTDLSKWQFQYLYNFFHTNITQGEQYQFIKATICPPTLLPESQRKVRNLGSRQGHAVSRSRCVKFTLCHTLTDWAKLLQLISFSRTADWTAEVLRDLNKHER